MGSSLVAQVLPEWETFAQAVAERSPDQGTWCEAWTVRDIVVHQAGNAEELARVLGGHLAGAPVDTRSFEEREAPYQAMTPPDLWSALVSRMEQLAEISQAAAADLPADTDVAWTGRTMKIPWFAEHMREELALHRWDITGDDATAQSALGEPWMTDHTVVAVGRPLLQRGSADLDLGAGGRVQGRLRVAGTDDVVVTASREGNSIELAPPEGPATLETDAAARILFLWGRRPADPSRWTSEAGPEALRLVRALLSGY